MSGSVVHLCTCTMCLVAEIRLLLLLLLLSLCLCWWLWLVLPVCRCAGEEVSLFLEVIGVVKALDAVSRTGGCASERGARSGQHECVDIIAAAASIIVLVLVAAVQTRIIERGACVEHGRVHRRRTGVLAARAAEAADAAALLIVALPEAASPLVARRHRGRQHRRRRRRRRLCWCWCCR